MIIEEFEVEVGGELYKWWVSRQPQWCDEDGWQGTQLTISLAKNQQKILLVQLPFEVSSRRFTPHRQRPNISANSVTSYISQAIEAGWEPYSRGKLFRYVAS